MQILHLHTGLPNLGFLRYFKTIIKNRLAKAMIEKYESSNPKQNSDFKKNKILQKCIQSNCIIAIFMTRDVTESVPEWEEIAATAMAVQNMWLTCVENNIGCYWSSPKYMSLMNDFFIWEDTFIKINYQQRENFSPKK